MKEIPCIAIDFDGTLVAKKKWPHFGKLKYFAKDAWRLFEEKGWEVIVFTARDDLNEIKRYLRGENLFPSEVTNRKPKRAWVMIDDRGVRFENNWKETADQVFDIIAQEKDKKLGKA